MPARLLPNLPKLNLHPGRHIIISTMECCQIQMAIPTSSPTEVGAEDITCIWPPRRAFIEGSIITNGNFYLVLAYFWHQYLNSLKCAFLRILEIYEIYGRCYNVGNTEGALDQEVCPKATRWKRCVVQKCYCQFVAVSTHTKWVKKVSTLPPATINVKSPTEVQEYGCIFDCCATDIQIVQLFSIQIFLTP